METYLDLYKRLRPVLQRLDKERERKLFFVIPISIVCLFLYLCAIGFVDIFIFGDESLRPDNFFFMLFIQIIYYIPLIGCAWLYSKLKEYMGEYEKRFKTNIIKPILSSIADNVNYRPDDKFKSKDELEDSEFISERPSRIDGEDLVEGNIEGIKFAFSEIYAVKKTKTSNGKTSEETLLDGVFFIGTFPKAIASTINISGKSHILKPISSGLFSPVVILCAFILGIIFFLNVIPPETIISFLKKRFLLFFFIFPLLIFLFLSVARKYKTITPNSRLTQLNKGSLYLKENYRVYADSPSDVDRILTKEVQSALVSFQKKTLTSATIHIRNEMVYIFIPNGFNIFEPKWFRKNTDPKVIQESYDLMRGFRDIIVTLKSTI